MPQTKPIIKGVPRLYRMQAVDHMMFGYVMGMMTALPGLSVKRCVESFMQEFDLCEDNYPLDSAHVHFYKMFKEFRAVRKDGDI